MYIALGYDGCLGEIVNFLTVLILRTQGTDLLVTARLGNNRRSPTGCLVIALPS